MEEMFDDRKDCDACVREIAKSESKNYRTVHERKKAANIVTEVAPNPNVYKTIGGLGGGLCITHNCQKYKQNTIESFGYGKGWTTFYLILNTRMRLTADLCPSGSGICLL